MSIRLPKAPGARLVLVAAGIAVAALVVPALTAEPPGSLSGILRSGEITVITGRAPHHFHVYRNQPGGFDYELAREFARTLGVRLRVVAHDSWEEMVAALNAGDGDFIAAGTEITPSRARQVAFSAGYREVHEHLIGRRNQAPVLAPEALAGRTVDVGRGSPHHETLEALRAQGVDVVIRARDNVSVEELIQQVARGDIDFTVANTGVALLNRRYHPAATLSARLRDDQPLGWAVHPQAQPLLQQINAFLKSSAASGRLEDLYEKYHWSVGDFDYIDLKTYHARLRSRLPRFRPFIKAAAERNGFDWCLIAAQIYRESHLDPAARGANDAQGLMQIRPGTARALKLSDPFDPVGNIRAGVQYLKALYDRFEGSEAEDRLMIALAAYNAGPGHVMDAQALAARQGWDPLRWESVARALPLLRERRHYREAEHGFCRGDIPVAYVKHIRIYYDILKRQELETALARTSGTPRAPDGAWVD
jgi:membrane-bound lytic murein transglycosylase F